MNHLAFLKDTVSFYSADPINRRAVTSAGSCVYLTEDGKKCAIGRFIKEDETEAFKIIAGVYSLLEEHPSCLKRSVAHLNKSFLSSVQNLHDANEHWHQSGLTQAGSEYVDYLTKEANRFDQLSK